MMTTSMKSKVLSAAVGVAALAGSSFGIASLLSSHHHRVPAVPALPPGWTAAPHGHTLNQVCFNAACYYVDVDGSPYGLPISVTTPTSVSAQQVGFDRPDHRPTAPVVFASCDRQTTEVFYTVPASPSAVAVSTSLGGAPLTSWTEPGGNGRVPVVVGLPGGLGGTLFAVVEGHRSAAVALPSC